MGPALAEEPVSAEVQHVPAALGADLSTAEQHTLSDLTDGKGVPLSAFVDTPGGPRVVTLDAGSRAEAAAAVSLLDTQPSVETAALAVQMRPTAGAVRQWGNDMVRSDLARTEVTTAVSNVVVAVVDTGVAPHPELDAALLPGQNFTTSGTGPLDTTDRYGHGTHVAGTIGADAGSQVEGVAAGVRLLPVKVLSDQGYGYSSWVAAGIVWAADHGADVINMSLGSTGYDAVLAAAVDHARAAGVTVVAAAGNNNSSDPFYPAALPGVIAVSAVTTQQAKARFSNYGSYVDVAAPGTDIFSTYLGGGFATMSGTSMASPHVAAIAALEKAVAPDLTPDQVELALEGTATDLGSPGRDDVYGRGLVDAERSVQVAEALRDTGQWPDNHPPVASDRTVTTRLTPDHLTVDVLSGATDPDGDALTVSSFSQGRHGVVLKDGRQLAYEPTMSGPFTDTFTYTVDDGFGNRSTGTVTLHIGAPDPTDRAPQTRLYDLYSSFDNNRMNLQLGILNNASDPDGDPLRVVTFTQPANGTVTLAAGDLWYQGVDGVWGLQTFRWTVTDGRGRYATGDAHINIRHPNTLPVAQDASLSIGAGSSYADLTVPATDPDSDDHWAVRELGAASYGRVSRLSDTALRYTASADLPVGTTDSFTYTVTDDFGGTATATVHVSVVAPAAPTAPALGAVSPGNQAVTVAWTRPADPGTAPVSGYVVRAYLGDSLARSVTVPASAFRTTVTGLVNGRAYTVRVTAVNAVGAGPDSARSAAVVPLTVPVAPRLGTSSAGRGCVTVRWAAPTSNGGAAISGYIVRTYRGATLVKSTTVSARALAATIAGLAPGVAYTFRVQAVNAAGAGPVSAASTVRPAR
jgi:subtilisin family serine protease